MPKQAVNKKPKRLNEQDCVTVHDIISKIKDDQKKLDQKLEELSQMCGSSTSKSCKD